MVFGNLPPEYNKVRFYEDTVLSSRLFIHGKDDDIILDDGVDHIAQAVHGPYDPAVFYGKKDLPLREVNFFIENKSKP